MRYHSDRTPRAGRGGTGREGALPPPLHCGKAGPARARSGSAPRRPIGCARREGAGPRQPPRAHWRSPLPSRRSRPALRAVPPDEGAAGADGAAPGPAPPSLQPCPVPSRCCPGTSRGGAAARPARPAHSAPGNRQVKPAERPGGVPAQSARGGAAGSPL